MSTPKFLADEDFHFRIVQAVRRSQPRVEMATIFEIGHVCTNTPQESGADKPRRTSVGPPVNGMNSVLRPREMHSATDQTRIEHG